MPAESAPAPEVEVQEISVQDRLDHATQKELDHWRSTGEIPAVKVKAEEPPKPAESAPAKEEVQAKPAATPPAKSETAAASPAAKPAEAKETRSERRYREITRENRELRERLEALERKSSQPAAEAREKPESQPAAAAEPSKLPAKPKLTDNDPKTGKPFASLEA
jgi:hypothetical protein